MIENKSKKIERITKNTQFEQVMRELSDGYMDGSIEDIIICARQELDKESQKRWGCRYLIKKYWIGGDSCVVILGLLEYMKMEIKEFILNRL